MSVTSWQPPPAATSQSTGRQRRAREWRWSLPFFFFILHSATPNTHSGNYENGVNECECEACKCARWSDTKPPKGEIQSERRKRKWSELRIFRVLPSLCNRLEGQNFSPGTWEEWLSPVPRPWGLRTPGERDGQVWRESECVQDRCWVTAGHVTVQVLGAEQDNTL